VLSEAVLVIVLGGAQDARRGAPVVIIEHPVVGSRFKAATVFDDEHEHRRKRLSTSTIESAWVDERNGRNHAGRANDSQADQETATPVLACISLFCLSEHIRNQFSAAVNDGQYANLMSRDSVD
jgi:hypothetical protein